MRRQRIDIERLVHNKILGIITPEEEITLNEWLREEKHQESFDHLMNAAQLADRYAHYAIVDANKAWEKFMGSEKIGVAHSTVFTLASYLIKYAAAILVLFIVGAGYWYLQYTKITPPKISGAVQFAMQQSIKSGKQEAEIVKMDIRKEMGEDVGRRNASDVDKRKLDNSSSALSTQTTSNIFAKALLSARRITTRHDKEFWLTLEDGTLVHLNYDTRLIYPEKFGRVERNVILDGEAYFMVAKDKSRPFVVHTPNGNVKVYGTEFNVNTKAENASLTSHATTVVLVEGSISVTPVGDKETMLKPGQKISILNSQFSIEEVDVEPYVAWNTGRFVFHEWTLEKIMNILSRWYGKNIVFKEDDLRQMTFSGNLNRYGNIQPTMEIISSVAQINIILKGNTIIIQK